VHTVVHMPIISREIVWEVRVCLLILNLIQVFETRIVKSSTVSIFNGYIIVNLNVSLQCHITTPILDSIVYIGYT